MKRLKKKRLERAGWVVGDTTQFLELSEEENRLLELKWRSPRESANCGNEGG